MLSPDPLPPLPSRAMRFAMSVLLASERSIHDPDVWDAFCSLMMLCQQRSIIAPRRGLLRVREARRADYERANAALADAIAHYRRRAGVTVDGCTNPTCPVCRPGITKENP